MAHQHRNRSMLRPALLALGFVLFVGGCASSNGSRETLVVFAASSLTDAFADLEQSFEAQYPGVDVQLNLAGSYSLREQILQGAPADVLATANATTMQAVTSTGVESLEAHRFATNRLVLALPRANDEGVASLSDLARPELLVGLCLSDVPCGDFADRVLAEAGVEASIDTREPNVRALLTKIAAGELDAGLVYATDVQANPDVVGIELAGVRLVQADYMIAALDPSSDRDASSRFVEYVLSLDGQAVLVSHGFGAG